MLPYVSGGRDLNPPSRFVVASGLSGCPILPFSGRVGLLTLRFCGLPSRIARRAIYDGDDQFFAGAPAAAPLDLLSAAAAAGTYGKFARGFEVTDSFPMPSRIGAFAASVNITSGALSISDRPFHSSNPNDADVPTW